MTFLNYYDNLKHIYEKKNLPSVLIFLGLLFWNNNISSVFCKTSLYFNLLNDTCMLVVYCKTQRLNCYRLLHYIYIYLYIWNNIYIYVNSYIQSGAEPTDVIWYAIMFYTAREGWNEMPYICSKDAILIFMVHSISKVTQFSCSALS
jgi:hypothetical protein